MINLSPFDANTLFTNRNRTRVVAVVQARMGSTRLPGKVLRPILGKPMIGWMAERLAACSEIDEVVISTTDKRPDGAVARFAAQTRIRCYRGSEEDLIDRLYGTAQVFEADALVRVTGDCPFVDPDIVDRLVRTYRELDGEVDFITNNYPPTYPHGLDAEVIPTSTLKRLWNEITDLYYREWVPYYIREHHRRFRTVNVPSAVPLSHLRWTVDYAEDLAFARRIFKVLAVSGRVFRMSEVLKLLEDRPELMRINAHCAELARKA